VINRRLVQTCGWLLGILLLVPQHVRAQEVDGVLRWLGQVRDGDQDPETEAPNVWDGALGLTGLPYRTNLATSFLLERDFATNDGVSNFYSGFLHSRPGAGLDMTLGRQFLSNGPGGVFVADAGKVRINRGPLEFTVFGGVPRYFEPTYGSEIQSQDEVLFGGSVGTARLAGSRLSIGYLQLARDSHELRQLVTGTATRACPGLPGRPSLYGSVAYDADRQNLDLATGGASFFWAGPRLNFNVEGSYYLPQDQSGDRPIANINRREDAIFQLFSISKMGQGRAGVQHSLTRTVSTFADYSFQHYNESEGGQVQNGHVASAGLLWMPGGDGLEVVRLEYYVIKTEDDTANGGKAYYESRVYERLAFRTKLDVTRYEKVTNATGTAVSGLLGVGYELCRGFEWELNFEANHNERFDQEFRFGFLLSYKFRHDLGEPLRRGRQS
jgi:hypothetical protein